MASRAPPSCRYLGPDAQVVTARGQLPVQRVGVGDWVLSGDGGWAAVTHTRRVLHRGALVHLDLAGGGHVRATRALPISVGPGHFVDADHLTAGQTALVQVMRVPDAPDADGPRPHLAWMQTVRAAHGYRTHLRTPWGHFLAEPSAAPPKDGAETAPTLAGRYRITPAGLVRLAAPPPRGRTVMGEAMGRHRRGVWGLTYPPPPVLLHRLSGAPAPGGVVICEQSVAARRDGDRIEFGVQAARPPPPRGVRAVPRMVSVYGICSHAGWVFGLTLGGADTLIADGVVAVHFPQAPPEMTEADIEGG